MTQFTLSKQPRGETTTRFHVLADDGSICGIITVQNSEADSLERHWVASAPAPAALTPTAKQNSAVAAMVAASKRQGRAYPRYYCRQRERRSRRNAQGRKAEPVKQASNPARLLKDFNVAGMVRTGLWCERNLGVEVLSIGRAADNATEECVMEISGRALFVRIGLRGGWIWVAACGMDEGDHPEPLFNIGDGPEGWVVVRRFLTALERSGIASLRERPLSTSAAKALMVGPSPEEEMSADNYASRILAARQRAGLGQRRFARLIGVGVATVQNWEHNRRTPQGLYQQRLEEKLREIENPARSDFRS